MATLSAQPPEAAMSMGQNADAGPSRISIQPMPLSLDLSCPVSLPSRKGVEGQGHPWPYPIAYIYHLILTEVLSGPSSNPDELPIAFVRRRYLETLCLSDLLAPLPTLVLDLQRVTASPAVAEGTLHPLVDLIKPLLLPLPQIQAKYRRALLPLVTALTATSGTATLRSEAVGQAVDKLQLDEAELGVLRVAIELRTNCRVLEESNGVLHPKKVLEELERRETLIQIIFLLLVLANSPSGRPEKKRKRERSNRDKPSVDDPAGALELLIDRLSVWHAVADLGIGVPEDARGKKREDEGMQGLLRRFWEEVLVPLYVSSSHRWFRTDFSFLAVKPDLCSSFHLKVFGSPIPPKLLPSTVKKPRKPKQTHPKPSTDELVTESLPAELIRPPPPSDRDRTRSISRAPSVKLEPTDMRRSLSRTSDNLPPAEAYRRSRSRSVDPAPKEGLRMPNPAKKALGRAPSGKDLFKGREVGLMMRATSIASRKDKERVREESQGQSQALGRGLLGRKTSDLFKRKVSGDESQSQPRDANTIIFATPSRPRVSHSTFGRPSAIFHPTPIQEEPSSGERPSFIAETPVHPHRLADIPMSGLDSVNEDGDESDDPLADLMVPTDDEDEPDDETLTSIVPETPAR